MGKLRNLIAGAALLLSSPAVAQQGVPFFPQTLSPNTVVGRLSSGQGPTEEIPLASLLTALFPNGSAAYPFSAASVLFQGSVNGAVTVQAQAAAGTWTLKWPTSQGTTGQCFTTSASGVIATTTWTSCGRLGSDQTWTGVNTFNGNVVAAGILNATGTFQKGGTTQTFPPSGSLVGISDTQTLTNKSIDAGQITGTIANARLSAGIGTNALLTKTANYTIASGDCQKTISGTGGPWTLTLPAVAGFDGACVVQACNNDPNDNTHSSILLSGWPAPSFDHLYMQQCQQVSIVNGAWVITKWPGKWTPTFIPTCYVDTGGNDANDCLVSSGATHAVTSPQHCFTHFQTEMNLGGAQPTCALTGGQTFNGGIFCGAAQVTTVYFVIGVGSNAIIRNTAGNVAVQENDFCGYIIFDRITFDCTSAASHPCYGLFIHQQNGADLSTGGFANGNAFIGANSGDIGIWCDSMCKINTAGLLTFTGTFSNLILMEQNSIININNGLTVSNSASIANAIFNANRASAITFSGTLTIGTSASVAETVTLRTLSLGCIPSLTSAGSGTPGRKFSVLDNSVLKNSTATAIPGTSAGIVSATGYANGMAPDNTGGGGGTTGINAAGCT
jgi:hypothetical protein